MRIWDLRSRIITGALRQGIGEVIYGAGKTPEQIHDIVASMVQQGQKSILITRMSSEAAEAVEQDFLIKYDKYSRIGLVGEIPEPDGIGKVVVAAAGTSDLPVAEEAAQTAECFGNEVIRLYDVGIAGLHRLLAHREEIYDSTGDCCSCRDGRCTCIGNRRTCRLSSDCSADQCRLWRKFWRRVGTAGNVKFLFQRS